MTKEANIISAKLNIIFACITALIILFSSHATGQTTLFQRTIGGFASDISGNILSTSEGGYLITGSTYSYGLGESNFYLLKLDAGGNLQWSKTFGGTSYDWMPNARQTTDGGYITAGSTESFGLYPRDIFLVKINSAGTLQWSRTIGTTNDVEEGAMVIQTSDGGYAITGEQWKTGTYYDIHIVKLDSTGTVQWARVTSGPTNSDKGSGIVQTPDGGYAVGGTYGDDMVLLKINASGTLIWSKTLGGTGIDNCARLIRTSGGDYILAGRTNSFGAGGFDVYIARLDSSGTIKWTRTIGGAGTDEGSSVVETQDGGFAVFGITNSFGNGNSDTYLIKLDSAGVLVWSRTAGATGEELGRDIAQNTNGEFFTTGQTASYGSGNQVYVVKFDAAGNSCGNTTSPTSISGTGGVLTNQSVTLSPITYNATSQTPTTASGGSFSSVCNITGIQPNINEIPNEFSLSQNYPNPFNPKTIIKYSLSVDSRFRGNDRVVLKVFDATGKEVATLVNEEQRPGVYEIEFDGNSFASGIYFYKLSINNEQLFTKKMVLIK